MGKGKQSFDIYFSKDTRGVYWEKQPEGVEYLVGFNLPEILHQKKDRPEWPFFQEIITKILTEEGEKLSRRPANIRDEEILLYFDGEAAFSEDFKPGGPLATVYERRKKLQPPFFLLQGCAFTAVRFLVRHRKQCEGFLKSLHLLKGEEIEEAFPIPC